MSLLSNQCDELRNRAGTLRAFTSSIGNETARNTMVIAATEMLEAADTIWELRCKMAGMVDQCDEIERLAVENIRMRQLVARMYRDMHGVIDCSTDTVFVDRMTTLRDCMDVYMRLMAELGMPPRDYESRRRELGIEAMDE